MVHFLTRGENTLDLILTNIPDKIKNVMGFDDILSTDLKLISFDINLKIQRKPKVTYLVYNFTKTNWTGLKDVLNKVTWKSCFVPGNIDKTLSNWCDVFRKVVEDYTPKHCVKNTYDTLGWIRNYCS